MICFVSESDIDMELLKLCNEGDNNVSEEQPNPQIKNKVINVRIIMYSIAQK